MRQSRSHRPIAILSRAAAHALVASVVMMSLAGCGDRSEDAQVQDRQTHASDLPAPVSGKGGVLDIKHERPAAIITPTAQPELVAVPGPTDAGAIIDGNPDENGIAAMSDAAIATQVPVGGDPASGAAPDLAAASPAEHSPPSAQSAVEAIRAYYAALNARHYAQAYEAWANAGGASGQTAQQFADGYATTASIDVQILPPGRIEAAAGTRYVQVPVRLTALQADGSQRRFGGSYTLRSSAVEGDEPAWRIASANLREIAD